MQQMPKPMLGEITALTITSPDLDASLAYYQKLGFKEVMRADWPFPWVQVSDGVLLIMLRKDPTPYLALTYYVKDIDAVANGLEKKGVAFSQKAKKTDPIKRYLLQSPDGLNVSLVQLMQGFSQPPGPGMLQMTQQDLFNPEKYVNKVCGLFGELAQTVTDLDKSIVFWELLGFSAVSKFDAPYPWAILTDGLAVIGLHQSNHFTQPAITFFAVDMPEKIAALKKNGLKDYKEQSPGNIALTTPEGQKIFLFSMGGGAEQKKKELKINVLETERLLLKELNPEVMDELFTNHSDDEIIAFMGLANKEELETERQKWQKGMITYRTSYKQYLLEEKATGKIIGRGGFHNWYAEHRRAELGYMMNDEGAKQKGYMKEAVAAIIRHGFNGMNLNRIEAFTGPANIASQRILEGAGFSQEGVLKEHFFKNGKMENSICYALLRSVYAGKKG